jgi:NAD(P)-dependent dehydrogenase (short-subunit alcohol dehydrogenase family)
MFDRIEQQLVAVDYLVDNAGVNRDALLASMSEEQWDEVIDTNLRRHVFVLAVGLAGHDAPGRRGYLQYRVARGSSPPSRPVQLLRQPRVALSLSPRHSLARWAIPDPGECQFPGRDSEPDFRQIH